METTNNDVTDIVIFVLEQIRADATIGTNRRFVHPANVAFYNTLETAEAAMRSYIEIDKKFLGDKEYRRHCLGYQIIERKVYNYPNPNEDPCYRWKSYSADGVVNQDQMS